MAATGASIEHDLAFAGAAEAAAAVARGDVTPRELVDLALRRIEALDPKLNAFRVVFADRARAEAEVAKPGDDRPLAGVPVAIKDDMDVEGEPTCFGTGAITTPAASDSEVTRRLRAAGAIVVGKTHVPELTQWPFTESATWGVTRNPWDLERTPGGSSGGSAAAVAAGLVPLATASDGLGSIRIPAACCGLFGLKPQRGRVDIAPKTGAWHELATYGTVTRTVADTALFLDAVAGSPPPGGYRSALDAPPGRLKVALSFEVPKPLLARPTAEVRDGVLGLAAALRELGHDVVERDPGYPLALQLDGLARYQRGIHDDLQAVEHPERVERRTRGHARLGALTPAKRVEQLKAEEQRHVAWARQAFGDADVLLTPVLASRPIEVGRFEGRGAFWTVNGSGRFVPYPGVWNVTGQPACSIPAGWTGDGLPLAAQLVGRPDDERTLLALAAQLEQARPWADRRPAGF